MKNKAKNNTLEQRYEEFFKKPFKDIKPSEVKTNDIVFQEEID